MTHGTRPLVVALGGNAILRQGEWGTVREQVANIRQCCESLLPLLTGDLPLVLTHGNGPQVGTLLLAQEATNPKFPLMPIDVCVAMTQGSLGYLLQRTIQNLVTARDRRRLVATVVTQVVVDPMDGGFWKPTKPVGPYYTDDEARQLRATSGWYLAEDAGRGHRRVVSSPTPLEIVERSLIRSLALAGHIVIAAGGGGVPVVRSGDGTLVGMEGVIDKDLASARLALDIGAGQLLILTGVEHVVTAFGTPEARPLGRVTLGEVARLLAEGHFPAGSMGPKIQAAVDFLSSGGREVIITAPEAAAPALAGETGTHIVPG